jgi:hypothetical protein
MLPPVIRSVAALLLLCQGIAAAAAGLVHAGERLSAPPAIETHHGSACVVVHDPARCPSCHVGGVAAAPQAQRQAFPGDGTGHNASALATGVRPACPLSRATPPRAPPLLTV